MNLEKIKILREKTGLSISECKKALEEANYNLELAEKKLSKKAQLLAQKKTQRETKEGVISAYVHSTGKVGAMVELLCETDFVAKNEDFKKLAHEICLQVAAMNPQYISPEDIPEEVLEGEKKILEKEFENIKDPKVARKAMEGKLEAIKEEISLLSQPWIKDSSRKIADLIEEHIAKFGENIKVSRFVRFEI